MSADAGFCALAHFDLDGGTGFQVILVYAEAAAGYLDDGIGTVLVKVFMQAALAGVVENTQRRCCSGQGGVRVVADGAIAHGGKHDRHREADLGREIADDLPVFIPADLIRLFTEGNMRFHRLAQRIDRRIGDLGGVDQDLVPVHRKRFGIAHGRKQYTAAGCLFVDFANRVV